MQRRVILVLLNNSLGEIHFILPYLLRLKSASDVDIYFYFINAKIYNKALDDTFYYDQIARHGIILKPNDLLYFLLGHRKRVSLILKDTTPLTGNNIVIRIKLLCADARLVLFPHAYALLGYKHEEVKAGVTSLVEDEHVDHVLYVHPFDMPTLARRYAANKLMFAGALGYSAWWSAIVRDYVNQNRSALGLHVPQDRIVVLFTLRDVHRTYLSEENFNYLFTSALEVIFRVPLFYIIIKPHPRQDMGRLKQFLAGYDASRYTISYFNTFVLSHFSNLNVSFWSSSVTDCLAMGIPSIEFHRFHEAFSQTIQTNGNIVSIYSHLGLTAPVTSGEALEKTLPVNREEVSVLYRRQRQNLDEVFTDTEAGYVNFTGVLQEKESSSSPSSWAVVRTYLYFILKFIFRKFKPV